VPPFSFSPPGLEFSGGFLKWSQQGDELKFERLLRREGGKDACARRRHPGDVPRIDAIPVLGIGVVAERSECTALY